VILYLDTSALVKLYVDEPGTSSVIAQVDAASVVATARVAYAEARAAFARKRREGGLDAGGLRQVVRRLDDDWSAYSVVEVNELLVRRAGSLAERHGLRGYDAIHLAASLEIRHARGEVQFACFDDQLRRAARRERLQIAALSP
jgi:predicted nucleic acid-binding protein